MREPGEGACGPEWELYRVESQAGRQTPRSAGEAAAGLLPDARRVKGPRRARPHAGQRVNGVGLSELLANTSAGLTMAISLLAKAFSG